MASNNPAVREGALARSDSRPLSANGNHAVVARKPSDSIHVVAALSQHTEMNVQGARLQVRHTAVKTAAVSATVASGPALQPNEALESATQRAPPSIRDQTAGEQVGIPTNGAMTDSRAPLPITNGECGLTPQSSLVPAPTNGRGEAVVCLEHTGDVSGQLTEFKVSHAHIQDSDIQADMVRAEITEEKQRQVVHRRVETTDDGEIVTLEYVQTERIFYRRVIEFMYIAASNEPENPEDQPKKERCIDCCFQSISCDLSPLKKCLFGKICRECAADNNNSTSTLSRGVDVIKHMSGILRRGRAKGWVIHTEMIFPLVRSSLRNIWVVAEIIAVFVSFVLSLATFTLGNNRVFSILHLVLSIVGIILVIIDVIIRVRDCCFKGCKRKREGSSTEATPDPGDNTSEGNKKCCQECINYTRNVMDVIRIIISELLFYPILICDIFEMITSETYFFDNAVDGLSFILFALSLASQLFFVYIIRIAILVSANYHSHKTRVPSIFRSQKKYSPEKDKEKQQKFDPSINKSAWRFQLYFIFHVCAQMVAQIMMFIAIAAAIREENEHLFNTDEMDKDDMSDESIHVSNKLWYMLVAGYILPICGILSFFIVTYFWVQQFPIGLCVDVMSGILQTPGIDDLKKIKNPDEEVAKINKVNNFIHFADLNQQFKDFRKTDFVAKYMYPFHSPQTVILSLVYAILQFVFVIFAFQILSGKTGLVVFCLVASCIGIIANFHVFTIALGWAMLIISVILFILFVLLCLLCLCFVCSLVHSDSRDNRQRY